MGAVVAVGFIFGVGSVMASERLGTGVAVYVIERYSREPS